MSNPSPCCHLIQTRTIRPFIIHPRAQMSGASIVTLISWVHATLEKAYYWYFQIQIRCIQCLEVNLWFYLFLLQGADKGIKQLSDCRCGSNVTCNGKRITIMGLNASDSLAAEIVRKCNGFEECFIKNPGDVYCSMEYWCSLSKYHHWDIIALLNHQMWVHCGFLF